MKDFAKLVVTLTVICSIAGILLAAVNGLTRDRIAQVEENRRIDAMRSVLPDFDNNPGSDTLVFTNDPDVITFHIARQGSRVVGVAFESVTAEGYGGDIRMMTGIDVAAGALKGIEILDQKETPGLGANIASDNFKQQFTNGIDTTTFTVVKDGGDINAIVAATISSRAVAGAIDRGVQAYKAARELIKAAPLPDS